MVDEGLASEAGFVTAADPPAAAVSDQSQLPQEISSSDPIENLLVFFILSAQSKLDPSMTMVMDTSGPDGPMPQASNDPSLVAGEPGSDSGLSGYLTLEANGTADAPTHAGNIITGPGPGGVFGPHVRGWNFDGANLTPRRDLAMAYDYFAYGTLRFGANVGQPQEPAAEDGADVPVSPVGEEGGSAEDAVIFDTEMVALDISAFHHDSTGVLTQGENIITGAGPGVVFGPQVRGASDLSGNIPTQLGSLASPGPGEVYGPQVIDENHLTGGIPTQIGNLTGPGPGDVYGPHVRETSAHTVLDAAVDGVGPVQQDQDIDSFFDIWVEHTSTNVSSDDVPMPQNAAPGMVDRDQLDEGPTANSATVLTPRQDVAISFDASFSSFMQSVDVILAGGSSNFTEEDLEAFILDLELGLE